MALVVGVVLTTINQLDVILAGDATAVTWVNCGLNFVVPFVVSNLGLLSGRQSDDWLALKTGEDQADEPPRRTAAESGAPPAP
ncbi:MAG: nitrate/nitrite transporter NrtS [Thermoleophilaceae bacterium]